MAMQQQGEKWKNLFTLLYKWVNSRTEIEEVTTHQ
jgi:hypothetical protein